MPSEKTNAPGTVDKLLETVCEYLPNCGQAMDLVEKACVQDLTAWERARLKYHGRLCPFCGCATGKFESALKRMEIAQAERAAEAGAAKQE